MATPLTDGFFSLFSDINKIKGPDTKDNAEGLVGAELPELALDMGDEELLKLKKKWEADYDQLRQKMEPVWKQNEAYWVGQQFSTPEMMAMDRPLMDNRIFMALETFLPIATRNNPEPVVMSMGGNEEIAAKLGKMLTYQSDILRMKLKLKQVMRNWALYQLGVAKIGWDLEKDDITIRVIRPQRLILDKDATVEECNYTGRYIGEVRRDSAETLISRFPKMKREIIECVGGEEKIGSEVAYQEWWTPKMVFWTLKQYVLGKMKNPHWNYEETMPEMDPMGQVQEQVIPGQNHFKTARMPYVFLSVFNKGLQPFDDTGLIQQNLSMQDLINKRMRQIDSNADTTNGVWIASSAAISKDQLARIKGRANEKIWLDGPDVNGIKRDTGRELPQFVYQNLQDARNELDNVFGTRGSAPAGIQGEQTVRGKILSKSLDTDRIGGGISEYLEQFADETFNWMVQMMYVYYDVPHTACILGSMGSQFIDVAKQDLGPEKILVSVKSGSMIPKDPMTQRNEAIDLWTAGAIDPLTLFEKLDFADPQKAVMRLIAWKTGQMTAETSAGQAGQPPPAMGGDNGGGASFAPPTGDEQTAPAPQAGQPSPMSGQQLMQQVPLASGQANANQQ